MPLNGSGTVPSWLAPGTYYIWVIVDADNTVPGQNTTNDRLAAPVTVIAVGTADLASLASETDARGVQVAAGQNFTKSWTLRNSGTSTWNSSYSLQYVSGNTGCSHSAVAVSGAVEPNSTYTFSISCKAPTTAGTYREDWRLVGPSGTIPVSGSPTVYVIIGVKPSQTPVDAVTVVSQTVPDGTSLLPGENFVKVWRLKNTGTTTWTNYRAIFIQDPGGGATSVNLLTSGASGVSIPAAAAGEIVDLSLPMRAPATPGVYASYWQLQNAAGTAFGPLLSVQIQVQSVGNALQISSQQSYEAPTRTLVLAASAVDNLSRPVTSAVFNWSLHDSSGTQRAEGSLTYQSSQWVAPYTLPAVLTSGLYTVRYSLTDGARTGAAVGNFAVGDLVDLTGVVRDARSRAPISAAEVRAGGRTTQTDAAGKYLLSGLNPTGLTTISVTKSGYTPYDAHLQPLSGARTIVRDVELVAASIFKPVITQLTAQSDGVFLAGVPFINRYRVRVNWNGSPGTVEFYYDGKLMETVLGTASGAEASFDVGGASSSSAAIRTVRVIARNQAGVASDPVDKKIALAPFPNWLRQLQVFLICGVLTGDLGPESITPTCTSSVSFVDLQKVLPIPVLGKFGAEVSIGAEVEYDIRSAQLDLTIGPEFSKEWGKPGMRPHKPFLTRYPRLKVYVGNKEVSGSVKGGARSTYLFPTEWENIRPLVKGSLEAKVEATRVNLLDSIPGLGTTLDWIGLRQVTGLTSLPLYATIGADGEVVFMLDPELKIASGELNLGLGLELVYEPKISSVADLRVHLGTKTPHFQVLPELLKDFALQVYAGYEARVWHWQRSQEVLLIEYPSTSGQGAKWLAIPVRTPDADSGFRPLKRDYREAGPPRFMPYERGATDGQRQAAAFTSVERFRHMAAGRPVAAGSESFVDLPFLANTFPYSEPYLAARGAELMMVYVADSGNADPANFTDIHYSFFDGNDWSQPAAISADPRAEFAPKVAFDGNGDAIAVWKREKDTTLPADAPIEAVASKMEIVWSRWDRAARAWSAPAPLTDNDRLDHLPLLIGPMEDGGLIAVWTENPSNLLVGSGAEGSATASRVWWVRWDPQSRSWSQPAILVPSVVGASSQSLAGTGRRAVYAWTRDTDGDPATSSDQELFYVTLDGRGWSSIEQLTRDAIADRNVRAAVAPEGEIYLVWQRGSDLVMDRKLAGTPVTIRLDSSTLGFEDFALTAGPSGNLALLWQGTGVQGTDIFYKVFDPASGSWGADMQLTDDRNLERSLAAAWDSAGNLTLAYNLVAVSEVTKSVTLDDGRSVQVEGVPEFGQVDLRVIKKALRRDVGLRQEGLTVDCAPCLPGQTITVQAIVDNLGDLPIPDLTVAFYAGDPAQGGQEIGRATSPGLVQAGGSTTTQITWTPVASLASEDLYAVIDPDNRISETDETNNAASIRVGGADLSVSLRNATAELDGSARIVVEIRNVGTVATGAAQAAVTPVAATASSMGTALVPALNLSESAEVALNLPPGSVEADQSQFEIEVEYAGDVNTANNKVRVAIQPVDLQLKTVEKPQILPPGGKFTGPTAATVVCTTEGALIRYTTDGKDPTEDDPVIPSGSTVPITSSVTLKAKAWKSGWIESPIATAVFTVAATPPAVPNGGM